MPATSRNRPEPQDVRPAEALERLVLDCQLEHGIRSRAVRTLSQIGDRHSEGILLRALNDEYPIVRHEAIHALAKIGGSESRAALESLLDGRSPYLRSIAAKALIELFGVPGGEQDNLPASIQTSQLKRRAH